MEIDANGNPRRADGRAVLEAHPEAKRFEYPTEDHLDAAASWFGGLQGGQGWPGYRGATFQNSSTGVGTPRDKTTFGAYWAPWRLSDPELLAMYNGCDIGAKIVDAPIDEMFRNGWEVGSRDLDTDSLRTLDDKASKLRVTELLNEGAGWGRLFGGALNIIGAEDGRNPDEELNEQGIKALHYLNVVDRRFIWVQRYYSDMLSPKYGLPEIYLITNVVSHGGMYGTTNPPPGTRLAAVAHSRIALHPFRWRENGRPHAPAARRLDVERAPTLLRRSPPLRWRFRFCRESSFRRLSGRIQDQEPRGYDRAESKEPGRFANAARGLLPLGAAGHHGRCR